MNVERNTLTYLVAMVFAFWATIATAQAGSYDLRFANTVVDCSTTPPTLCTTVQVKASSGTIQAGNSTVFVTYNGAALVNTGVTFLNFTTAQGYSSTLPTQYTKYEDAVAGIGEVNMAITLGSGAGTPTLTLGNATWTDVAQLCFTISNNTANANLAFNTTYTGFNDQTNVPANKHTLGTQTGATQALACGKVVKLRAFLQGPYQTLTSNMSKALNTGNLIPKKHPYDVAPYNYAGGETIYSFPTDMVDWVLVSAATAQTNASVVETRAALLKQNGDIVDIVTGSTGLNFYTLGSGNYYFIVRHRNHVSIVSSTSFAVPNATLYNYSSLNLTGTKQVATGVYAMKAGNSNSNDLSTKTLPSNVKNMVINAGDFSLWKASNPILNKYEPADYNLDKVVNSNDFSLWKGNNPTIGTAAVSY